MASWKFCAENTEAAAATQRQVKQHWCKHGRILPLILLLLLLLLPTSV
jgi:hypothetical protein